MMKRQSGLSLVEIMIVLVVVGLLAGAVIYPLGTRYKEDFYQRTRDDMQLIQTAIYGYAVRNQTIERTVNVTRSSSGEQSFLLPARRPYLPCPDVNGDGYEDRFGFDVTGTTDAIAPGIAIDMNASPPVNQLRVQGNCLSGRGVLPWKTLNVPPTDIWGNLYTYEVDDIISNALVGFGQDTILDVFDERIPVTLNSGSFFYSRRDSLTTNIASGGGTFIKNRRPVVVCDAEGSTLAACITGTADVPLAGGKLFLNTGVVGPRRNYRRFDVSQGLAYVIVSHGENGRGAANYQVNSTDAINALVCNDPIHGVISGAPELAITTRIQLEAVNFLQPEEVFPAALRYCNSVRGLINGHFVHQPRAGYTATEAGYDDILVWSSLSELIREVERSGAFPTNSFPVLRENI